MYLSEEKSIVSGLELRQITDTVTDRIVQL